MFWSVVSLVLLGLLIRFIFWLVKSFFAWLGRGKLVQRAIDNRAVSPEVADAVDRLILYRAARHIGKEMKKPLKLTRDQVRQIQRAEAVVRSDYVDHMRITWYHVVIIFLLCSFLGLVLEEFWMFVSVGLTQGRYGLVWGPFSPLYGFGALFLTAAGMFMRRKHAKWWQIFLASMVVGGLLEQITGWGMETFMGAVSWDYIAGGVPGAITKWVAVPFLFFWGFLGLAWTEIVMPWLLYTIGEPTTQRQVTFVALLAVYLVADIGMTLACFNRRAARDAGIPPQNAFQEWVDEHYSNEFMSNRFENMVIEDGASTTS